jgi:hypothetical protein
MSFSDWTMYWGGNLWIPVIDDTVFSNVFSSILQQDLIPNVNPQDINVSTVDNFPNEMATALIDSEYINYNGVNSVSTPKKLLDAIVSSPHTTGATAWLANRIIRANADGLWIRNTPSVYADTNIFTQCYFKFTNAAGWNVGHVHRYSATGFYLISLCSYSSSGTCWIRIYKYISATSTWIELGSLLYTSAPLWDVIFSFTSICIGNNLQVLFDDNLVFFVTDSEFTSGRPGLGGYLSFKWINVDTFSLDFPVCYTV